MASFFPAPAAIAIIFNQDCSQILLVKRKDIPLWVLPGGGVDFEETAEEAVLREVLEETGLSVVIERKCAEYTPINRLASFTSVFICQSYQGALLASEETAAIAFYPPHQLPSNFFKVHREWLEEALTNSTLIQKPLLGITYWACLKYMLSHPRLSIGYIFTRLKMSFSRCFKNCFCNFGG